MNKAEFQKYLKKGGRSPNAINRCLDYVSGYEEYLKTARHDSDIDEADFDDLSEFIHLMDKESNTKSKRYLWAIRYYYEYKGNSEMCSLAHALRQERIERKPFLLKDFRDISSAIVEILAAHGIRTTDLLLQAAAKQVDRKSLSDKTGIPEADILELVKLSDLARIPGVKGTRARLYYEAGIDSVEKIAGLEPDDLRNRVVTYVKNSDFDGVPTLPAEAIFTIEKARNLPIIVEN